MRKKRFSFIPFLFIGPHLILFSVFQGWPLIYGIYISLFDFDFQLPKRPFVGLGNYINLFNSASIQFSDFWMALKNTLIFVVISVPLLVAMALLLALLLNRQFKGRNFFRALYFAPYVLSAVVASVLWWWIFQEGGLLNHLLVKLNIGAVPWLGEQPWSWITILIATIWWTIGFNTIIYLAALQDIPREYYESAMLDGADAWSQFWYLTLPLLRQVSTFVLTMTVLASFNLFAQPFIITHGGPTESTVTIMMRIYAEGFQYYRMGSAAAMCVFVALILLSVTFLNFKLTNRPVYN